MKKEWELLFKRVLHMLVFLAISLVVSSCSSETPVSTEMLVPSETIEQTETIVQKTEPVENQPVASPTDYIEPPATPTTAPLTEALPAIDYENAMTHYTAGTEISISQIAMTEVTTGWAIGQKSSDSDHILKTTDGGRGWWDVTPPEAKPSYGEVLRAEAFFLDKSTAWVSYEPYEIVWRTTDAGITWRSARVPMAGNLGATLWFLDAENGWMMKYLDAGMNHVYSALFLTSTGGRFWVKVFDPYSDGDVQSFSKTGLVFADREIGWLTRDSQGVQPGAFVDATSDGGYTWEKVDITPPVDDPEKFNQEYCGMYEPELFSTSSGVLVVTCRRFDDGEKITTHFLARTSDGGATWKLSDYPGGDLHFINQNLAYALGRDIYKTTDGGTSWIKIKEVDWDGQFNFVNENTAWAVAQNESNIALVLTTNGCQTFSEIKPQVIKPPDEYLVTTPSSSSEIDPAAIGGGSKQVAFISYRENPDSLISDIYLMNINGTNLTKITDSSGRITHFSWSPDGQILVFDLDRDGDSEIYTIKADGTGLTQITSNSFYESDPDWSPDGTEIAYVSQGSGDYQIYLMNTDGSAVRTLVDGRTPAWSPDGSRIAFSRIDDGIYLIDKDGSNLTRLTDSSQHGWEHYPVWSPDGSLILFGSNLHQPGWAAAESIYVMRADGSGIGSLSEVWGMPPYTWSPDGQWIIYTQSFGTDTKLYIMDNQGFNVSPLMEDNGGLHPLWRP